MALRLLLETEQGQLGAKASRIAAISKAGYRIPRSWIIPSAYQDDVFSLNCISEIQQLQSLTSLRLPENLHSELEQLLLSLPNGERLVGRSSCSTEDLPFASAAGQYETFLGLDTADAIETAIVQCYRSLANPDVLSYLERKGLDPAHQRMAILLQQMIDVDRAGVMYTKAPQEATEMLIEYVDGNGVPVVSGTREPIAVKIPRETSSFATNQESYSVPVSLLQLHALGLDLEQLFAAPQDIEWGTVDGELVVFQSRDIVGSMRLAFEPIFEHPKPASAKSIRPLSWHLALGTLTSSDAQNLTITKLIRPDSHSMRMLGGLFSESSGIVCTTGGQLSHLASVCRELQVPAGVADRNDLDELTGKVVVMDCNRALLYRLDELSTIEKKRLVFDWARFMSIRGLEQIREETKVEGVITSRPLVNHIWRGLGIEGRQADGFVQEILPFDYPDRVYCAISARIQSEPDSTRVQFKRALPDEGGRFRQDHEIHVSVASVAEGSEMLKDLGYMPRPAQQRLLARDTSLGPTIQFNYWPFANGVYVGIEADDAQSLNVALQRLKLPENAIGALDGVDLFRMFDISLDRCLFGVGAVPSMNELFKKFHNE